MTMNVILREVFLHAKFSTGEKCTQNVFHVIFICIYTGIKYCAKNDLKNYFFLFFFSRKCANPLPSPHHDCATNTPPTNTSYQENDAEQSVFERQTNAKSLWCAIKMIIPDIIRVCVCVCAVAQNNKKPRWLALSLRAPNPLARHIHIIYCLVCTARERLT